ncbi:hypothetical protein ABTM75_19505, partial [Acinetobacter baumannii]
MAAAVMSRRTSSDGGVVSSRSIVASWSIASSTPLKGTRSFARARDAKVNRPSRRPSDKIHEQNAVFPT